MSEPRNKSRTIALLAVLVLSAVALTVALGAATVAQDDGGELTFPEQEIEDDSVTVQDVTTANESTVVVTYTDGDQEVVAGTADADELDGEEVTVEIEDDGGFPGEHTAWLFEDEVLGDDVEAGDDVADLTEEALVSDDDAVLEPPAGSLTFLNQEPGDDDTVTVENVTTEQDSTVIVTYRDGPVAGAPEIVAGMVDADELDGEDLTVDLEDTSGVPGLHTAWILADRNVPDDLEVGDDATAVTDAAAASQTAAVPPEASVTFPDQELAEDGTVTIEDVETGQPSTIVVSYTDGDQEVVAGVTTVDSIFLDVTVEIEDDAGFPGEHTVWVFDNQDVTDDIEVGDDVAALTEAALVSETADVTDEAEGELTVSDQELDDDDSVTVDDVTTGQDSTLVVSYTDGDEEVVAGVTAANNLDGDSVTVDLDDDGGFPGEHTVWVFDDNDVPADLTAGDDISEVTDAALDSGTVELSEADDGDDDDDDDDADDDGPGFGVAIAALALLGAAMLALYRRE